MKRGPTGAADVAADRQRVASDEEFRKMSYAIDAYTDADPFGDQPMMDESVLEARTKREAARRQDV